MRNPLVRAALSSTLLLPFACDQEKADASAPVEKKASSNAGGDRKVEVKAPPRAQPEPEPVDDTKKTPVPAALRWTIAAEPESTKLAKLGELRLRIEVTNEGDVVANPLKTVLHFTVDGEASQSLSLAFGNGGHGKEWTALEPGKSAESSRIGVAFVAEAGDHVVAISDGTTELARTTVHLAR